MAATDRFEETLLAPSMIRMFGRVFEGLTIDEASLRVLSSSDGKAKNPFVRNPLVDKLAPVDDENLNPEKLTAQLARIYGFSYEGNYYKLARPTVFLVHGPGQEILAGQNPKLSLSFLGVEFKDQVFAEGVLMWAYDKIDMSIRIDIASGQLEDILLDCAETSAANITGGGEAGGMTGRAMAVGRAMAAGRAMAIDRDK
jgi:hypothetical protein